MLTNERINDTARFSDAVELHVVRGNESWNFLYFVLGFIVAIEGTIIQMVPFLLFPWNIAFYMTVAAVTGWNFVFNGRFQNWVFRTKTAYESRPR